MIMTPSAPSASASREARITSSVRSAPVPTRTGTRPRAVSTTVRATSWRSSSSSERNSPVLPSGIRPWMPSPICHSVKRRRTAESTDPSAPNGVTITV